ncbi:MAG: hypothetical protein ACKVQA_26070 [Burkholderiales bacterium]
MISLRLTRGSKLDEHLALLEAESSDDRAGLGEHDDGAGSDDDPEGAATSKKPRKSRVSKDADATTPIASDVKFQGNGHTMSVATLLQDFLPDGAQYNGLSWVVSL